MKNTLFAILTAILSLLLATAVGLGIVCITDQPYLHDLNALKLEETSGFSKKEILQNYNAVIDFLSPFSNEEFDLPTMNYSASGASHFEDCKPIFNAVYISGLISFVLLALLSWKRALTRKRLRLSGILTLIIPAVLGLGAMLNFDRLFVLFHKVFFANDDWLFDPAVDEIITVLPEQFFLDCFVFIGAFWILAAALELICSAATMKK